MSVLQALIMALSYTMENHALDPPAVLHLDNWLCMNMTGPNEGDNISIFLIKNNLKNLIMD